ncbi:MAG: S-methyl-5-thioribose-1-phosphate isomerase, partial [Verrucomicrobiota bacterium]
MNVRGHHFRTIWEDESGQPIVKIIDQRHLPHRFIIEEIATVDDMATAIRDMHVRGAGLIGAAAGYGMAIAASTSPAGSDEFLRLAAAKLVETRPTAVNLAWAVERQMAAISTARCQEEKIEIAWQTARTIADEDADWCRH